MAGPAAEEDDLIAREIHTTMSVLAMQANVLKDSPEAAVLSAGSGKARSPAVSIELQRLEWLPEARTLRLSAYPEVSLCSSGTIGSYVNNGASGSTEEGSLSRAQQLLLAAPIQLELFFPESLKDPPLCFGSTDAAALVAERVNGAILPLERSSLLHAVSRIVAIIKQEVDSIWPPSYDCMQAFRRQLSAHIHENPRAADLLLSLLSMAKPHHPSVRFPLPLFFYRSKDLLDYPALLAALAAVPPLSTLVLKQEYEVATQGPPLPFASCVLLHHLFFRSRVALLDPHTNPADPPSPDGPSGSDPDDEDVQRLLRGAGITALPPSQQPSLVFRVAHGADARFTQAARCHGTRLGFHGSPPGNVFSIVALGLRNLSNSRGMLNGAAFGEGVYVASHLSVAREFSSWGTKVWRHSTFGAVPPQTDPKTAAPVFAYQIIACCEFVALDKYTKRLVPAPPSSSSSSSSGASRQQQQRQQQQQQQGGGGGRGAKAKSEYYVIEEAEQHLVVRLLLLFKDPAIGRQGGASPARATGPQTSTNPRVSAATAAAAAATAGGGGRGRHPQRRRRGWDSLLVVVRVVSSLFAILLLLDGLEQLLTRSGFLKHPALPRGGGGKRRTVQ